MKKKKRSELTAVAVSPEIRNVLREISFRTGKTICRIVEDAVTKYVKEDTSIPRKQEILEA